MTDPVRDAIDLGGGQTCDIEGVLRELDRAGYVIVPKEPTPNMREAGMAWMLGDSAVEASENAKDCYRAMIGAYR